MTFGMEESFRPFLDSGQLVPLLQDDCPPFAAFCQCDPSRQNLAPKLRALVDHVRRARPAP